MNRIQHELLTLIREHTEFEGQDASNPISRYWVPPHRGSQYSEALNSDVNVTGSGVASSLKGMERKGWIKAQRFNYSYSITEEGIVALESHREKTGFYPEQASRREAARLASERDYAEGR